MATPLALFRSLSAVISLTALEAAAIESMQSRPSDFFAKRELVHEQQAEPAAYVLHKGWAVSYKLLPDGGRQIVDFHVPGEMLGLGPLMLGIADHTVETVTAVTASAVSRSALSAAVDRAPRIANALLWIMARSEAAVAEHLADVGRRNAYERTGHLLLELRERLMNAGIGRASEFPCPLSQTLLADALGLTPIYLNRVLKALRDDRLLSFRNGVVAFEDVPRLMELTGFETCYVAGWFPGPPQRAA